MHIVNINAPRLYRLPLLQFQQVASNNVVLSLVCLVYRLIFSKPFSSLIDTVIIGLQLWMASSRTHLTKNTLPILILAKISHLTKG